MKSIQLQAVIFNNDPKTLISTLESASNALRVAKGTFGMDIEVKFVYGDSSSEPVLSKQDVEAIIDKFANISFKYTFFNENTGYGKGQNLMAAGSDCDFLIMMNPDVRLTPRFLYYILLPFSDKTVGMVEARQTPIEHQKEYNVKTFETDWATGACVAIRTDLFKKLNGFDYKTFFMYCEDVDISWRLRLMGFKIIYQPLAPVYHAKSLSFNGKWMPSETEKYYSAESALFIAHKWSNPELVETILNNFKSGNEYEKKAASEYLRRKSNGELPTPLDPEHKVSKFIGWYYTENRFVL